MPRGFATEAEHKCIQNVAFARAIGTDDRGESQEWPNVFLVYINIMVPKDLKLLIIMLSSLRMGGELWRGAGT